MQAKPKDMGKKDTERNLWRSEHRRKKGEERVGWLYKESSITKHIRGQKLKWLGLRTCEKNGEEENIEDDRRQKIHKKAKNKFVQVGIGKERRPTGKNGEK